MNESIPFTKMSGSGNDFILIDTSENERLNLTDEIVRKLCARGTGIGADGILLIDKHVPTMKRHHHF